MPENAPMTMQEPAPSFQPRGLLLSAALGGPLRRAITTGSIAGAVAAGIGVPAATIAAHGLGVVAAVAVGAALSAGVGLAVAFVALPATIRRAHEGFAWLGRRELDRMQQRTGLRVVATPADATRWLVADRGTPATAVNRAEVLAMLGRFDEARAELARLPEPTSDLDAVEHALNRAFVPFLETGAVPPEEASVLADLARRLDPRSEAGLEVAVGLAVAEARRRRDAGRADWAEPLLDVRPRLGPAATRTMVRDTWSRAALTFAIVGGAIGLLAGATRLV